MDFRSIALGVLLPAFICAAALLAAWRPWQKDRSDAFSQWGGSLGFGLAFAISSGLLLGWAALPPKENWQWLTYLSFFAVVVGLVNSWRRKTGLVCGLIFACASAYLLVPTWQEPRWVWIVALAGANLVLLLTLDPLGRRWQGSTFAFTFLLTSTSCSVLLVLSGNAKFGQLAAIVAACCATSMLLSWWCHKLTLAGGAIPVIALLLPGLMFNGHFYNYSNVPPACFFLLLAAPIAAWIGQVPPIKRMRPWKGILISITAILIPIIVVAILIIRAEFFQQTDFWGSHGCPSRKLRTLCEQRTYDLTDSPATLG